MEYTPRTWKPQQGTGLNKYAKSGETGSVVYLTRSPDSITDAGTPLTDAAMNNIESGLVSAASEVNEIRGVVDFTRLLLGMTGTGQTSRVWAGIEQHNGDVYAAAVSGYVYKQTGGAGAFEQIADYIDGVVDIVFVGEDLYAATSDNKVYKRTSNTGDFSLHATIPGMGISSIASNGIDLYVSGYSSGSAVYKQTNCTGSFSSVWDTHFSVNGLCNIGTDMYAANNGDRKLYKQTNSSGVFSIFSTMPAFCNALCAVGDDIYAATAGGIYVLYYGESSFVQEFSTTEYSGITSLDYNIYATLSNGDIYKTDYLTGNTWRTSTSFTMPALPVGARKRIVNIGSSTITVTLSGFTCNGMSYLPLGAGCFWEIEMLTSSTAILVGGYDKGGTGMSAYLRRYNGELLLTGVNTVPVANQTNYFEVSHAAAFVSEKPWSLQISVSNSSTPMDVIVWVSNISEISHRQYVRARAGEATIENQDTLYTINGYWY